MKKIIILKNNGGRLANQLWQYAAVYGFCLERGYECQNYSFFSYAKYFNLENSRRFFWFRFFSGLAGKQNRKIAKLFYRLFSGLVSILNSKRVVMADEMFFLPPSENTNESQRAKLKEISGSADDTYYFAGWFFQNPEGLKKYYGEIKKLFTPKPEYLQKTEKLILELRNKYQFIVGVHLRQKDYQAWQNGVNYFEQKEVGAMLDDFMAKQTKANAGNTVFIICSDGAVDEKFFSGINLVRGPGSEIEDLYALTKTDLIIGSNSTYGAWAAYYGNIKHVLFSRDIINWPMLI